jgi:hypothetical protein
MILPPTVFGARPGDILHLRSTTIYGRMIRRCLKSWGNHDAVLVWRDGWYVAEALTSGFALTPWSAYWCEIESGARLAFLRPPDMGGVEALSVQGFALEMARQAPRYDYLAIMGILWSIAGRANEAGREWDWYCTEAVRDHYSKAGWDVWRKARPTPLTTEKRILSGRLAIVTRTDYDLGALELTRHLAEVANAPA